MERLILAGGYVVDPEEGWEGPADVVIEEGRIAQVGPGLCPVEGDRARVLRVDGLCVTPGLVDPCAHLAGLWPPRGETVASLTRAAAAGGFTAVALMPDTCPPLDAPERLHALQERIREEACVRLYPMGALTQGLEGTRLAPLGSLAEAGVVAFANGLRAVPEAEVMRRALVYARAFRRPVMAYPEDPSLAQGGSAHWGPVALRLGLKGIPWAAEAVALARDAILAGLTGARLHATHVTTEAAVELLAWARRRGWPVTGQATPHHLLLDEQELEERPYDPTLRFQPPLRSPSDRQALVDALVAGEISCIATDHTPCSPEAKEREFPAAAPGASGLEVAFAVLYTRLCLPGKLPLRHLLRRMSTEPARLLGIPGGTLRPGTPADVACFDLERPWRIDPSGFRSCSRYTPFTGWTVRGRAVLTLVGGRIVHRSQEALVP